MKKTILFLTLVLFVVSGRLAAQPAMPSVMVVPSDSWCNEHGFLKTEVHDSVTSYIADYRRALVSDPDLKIVISLVNGMMTERGFRLTDLESTLKNIETENTLNSVTLSSMGDMLAETPREQLSRVAKADIWIEIAWKINNLGPRKSLTFTMRAIDAYTQKEVATAMGTSGETYAVELPVLLEEAVSSYIYDFTEQLADYFREFQANGREITLEVRVWDNAGFNLETDTGTDILSYIIEDWVMENAAGGMMTPVTASENVLLFRGLRMPNTTPEGRQTDARYWTRSLVRLMRNEQIDCKVYTRGLGHVMIVLGQK